MTFFSSVERSASAGATTDASTKCEMYFIAQFTLEITVSNASLVSWVDLGNWILEVASIVCLNLPNTSDKFHIFCRATETERRKFKSSIILTLSNFTIKLEKSLLNSSAATANSLNPSISMLSAICLDSLAILAAALNNSE